MPIQVAYQPVDLLKPVADDLWIVDSGPINAMGFDIPVRMTVVRLRSGEIWLHSPTRYDDALRRAVEQLGPIRHLVAPNIAHWTFVKDWQAQCTDVESWAAPGLRDRAPVRRSEVRLDHDLNSVPPAAWRDDFDQIVIPGGFGVNEVGFLHRPTRTLILTDLIENLQPEKLGVLAAPLARLVGATAPDGQAPAHLRFAINRRRADAKAAAQRMVEWTPERVIFAHGAWFEQDGTARLRRSMRWLLD